MVIGKMENIREVIKRVNLRDSDDIARAKEEIKEMLTTRVEYMRDIARMCEQSADVLISALKQNDLRNAKDMCETIVREANNLITKGVDLRRGLEEAEPFLEGF